MPIISQFKKIIKKKKKKNKTENETKQKTPNLYLAHHSKIAEYQRYREKSQKQPEKRLILLHKTMSRPRANFLGETQQISRQQHNIFKVQKISVE